MTRKGTKISASKEAGADVMAGILRTMLSMGVAPLPRNYRIFYDAKMGLDPELSAALTALGPRPSQDSLDELDKAHPVSLMAEPETVSNKMAATLGSLVSFVRKEEEMLKAYNKTLDHASRQFAAIEDSSIEDLVASVHDLGDVTVKTIHRGQQAAESVSRSSQEMADAYAELEEYKRLANTDATTGLNNRRAFDEKLAHVYDWPEMIPLKALIIADIDHFKKVNDTYGHLVGDKILEAVARSLKILLHKKCFFLARTGGEEFAIIVDGYTKEEVLAAAERVRVMIARQRLANRRMGFDFGSVTISMGVAMASQATRPEDLYRAADAALYAAKEEGRNRVVLFDDAMPSQNKNWLIYRREVQQKTGGHRGVATARHEIA